MTALRQDLPPLPRHMLSNPIDERGFPIPFFVAYVDGKPDFRVMDGRKWLLCVRQDRCWLCGGLLGRFRAFVLGPMCTITRTSAEPPSHTECAEFACVACPFLTKPLAKRPDREMPNGAKETGIMIKRNPGVSALWVVEKPGYHVFSDERTHGKLVKVHDPYRVKWYREAREANREEIMESIGTGLPLLQAQCDGPDDLFELGKLTEIAMHHVPA